MSTKRISEMAFEDHIEATLLAGGPDEVVSAAGEPYPSEVRERLESYGEGVPGGWHKRENLHYDPDLLLLSAEVIDFVRSTQPKEWERLRQHHGEETRKKFLTRLSREIQKKGTLRILRDGIRDSGCRFRLTYFRPSSGLNPDLQGKYEANLFSVVRQLHFDPPEAGTNRGPSLDLVLFLNGLPLFTAELKNPLTRQSAEHAKLQYQKDRDPRHPLFQFGRCLAHFAVDPEEVWVATHLRGRSTRFLPFNQGWDGGAGNPPVPPIRAGYPTDYVWERIFARDSVLNLLQHFIHEFGVEDEDGRKMGERMLIFPRYHQLDAVRRLVEDARGKGPGRQYLIQHSAGCDTCTRARRWTSPSGHPSNGGLHGRPRTPTRALPLQEIGAPFRIRTRRQSEKGYHELSITRLSDGSGGGVAQRSGLRDGRSPAQPTGLRDRRRWN